MRILHVFKVYLPDSFGGIERTIWEIAEATAPLGVEGHVFSLTRRPDLAPLHIGRHWSHSARQDLYLASTGLSLSAFHAFRTLALKADVIHYHFPWPFMDALHFAAAREKPSLVTYHSDIVRQRFLGRLYRPLMMRFLGSMDTIVATSPNYAQSSPVLRQFRDKVEVIPIGVADRAPPAAGLVEEWRHRVGDGFLFFVGELRYYKGLRFLAEAARATGLPVVIAGRGEMEAGLRGTPNLKLVGRISEDDKAALFSLCRAFVFPSHLRSEAFGVALLEAARAGKPMISAELGTGTSYINRDGETGLVVTPGDVHALAGAMGTMMSDADRAAEMGRRARQRYEQLFTASKMGRAYADLYARVMAAHALK
jgi:rhamnosyl/mannosyltransferase